MAEVETARLFAISRGVAARLAFREKCSFNIAAYCPSASEPPDPTEMRGSLLHLLMKSARSATLCRRQNLYVALSEASSEL